MSATLAGVQLITAPKKILTSTDVSGTTLFGLAAGEKRFVGTLAVWLHGIGLTGGAVNVQGLIDDPLRQANVDNITPLAIPYIGVNVNGTAGAGALVTTQLTPASADSLIWIPCSGIIPVLSIAQITAGSLVIYQAPVIGVAG